MSVRTAPTRFGGLKPPVYKPAPSYSPNRGPAVGNDPLGTLAAIGGTPYTQPDIVVPPEGNPPFGTAPMPGGEPSPYQPPPQPGNGRGSQPSQPDPGSIDYSGDPILAKIRALSKHNYDVAVANTLAAEKQQLINFGSADLANQFQYAGGTWDPVTMMATGAGPTGDAATAAAAAQNPFSVLANLLNQHTTRTNSLEDNLNKANLFYSSTRGDKLNQEQRDYLGAQATAQGNLMNVIGGLVSQLTGAQQAEIDRLSQAETDAYNRAWQTWLAEHPYGSDPGGGGEPPGGGTPTNPALLAPAAPGIVPGTYGPPAPGPLAAIVPGRKLKKGEKPRGI